MMPTIAIAVDGHLLTQGFNRASGNFDRLLMDAFRKTVEQAAAYAKQGGSPAIRVRSGTLFKSIRTFVNGGFGGVAGAGGPSGRVQAEAPYAKYLEDGTKAHMIRPINGRVLRWRSGGGFAFSTGHMVRGIQPRKFMTIAKERVTPYFERLLSEAISKAFE